MNNFTLKAGAFVVGSLLSCTLAFANGSSALRWHADKTTIVKGKQVSKVGKAPESGIKTQAGTISKKGNGKKAWSDGTTEADILVDEDFSAFTAGTPNKPDTKCLASFYTAPGMYIDPSLTNGDQWAGNNVYSAGGKVALVSPTFHDGSTLNTPLGDYSGDLTITFKVKALVNADLFVNVLKGGYANCDDVKTPAGEDDCWTGRIYANQGWKEVTVKITNYSADNDGFIQFQNYGTIVLDDIKITTTTNFLADPKVVGETNFTGTSFTANWEPTHKAYNYYLNLYKKRYIGDSDVELKADFEDGTLPEGWSFSAPVADRIGEYGADDGMGLKLENGDTLTLPHNLAKLKDLSFWLHIYDPDPDDATDVYDTEIALDFLTLNGWEEITTITPDDYVEEGDNINIFDALKSGNHIDLTDQYYGARIRVSGLPEGDYVALDDIYAKTGRPAVLDEVFDPEFSINDGSNESCYDISNKTSYTFKDLDPNEDYYYKVRAHYLRQASFGETLRHAIGVATPSTKVATNVEAGKSFTANWTASPRATAYEVSTYGVTKAAEAQDNYPLITEDFSKIDDEVTDATDPNKPEALGNSTVTLLDDYTAQPGWTTYNTTVAQGMVGVQEGYGNYIATPEFHVGKAKNVILHVKAYGVTDDGLVMQSNSGTHGSYFKSKDGNSVVDGTFVIPCTTDSLDKIYFSSSNGQAFILDEVSISRAVEAGESIFTFLKSKTVDGKENSLNVDGLDAFNFEDYAFAVKAEISEEGEYAESNKSGFQLISAQSAPTTGISLVDGTKAVNEVARYTVDGKRISKAVKGINLVKLSDGRVIKVVVNQ